MLVDEWYKYRNKDAKEESKRIIKIRNHQNHTEFYPSTQVIENLSITEVPEILIDFMKYFTEDSMKQYSNALPIQATSILAGKMQYSHFSLPWQ